MNDPFPRLKQFIANVIEEQAGKLTLPVRIEVKHLGGTVFYKVTVAPKDGQENYGWLNEQLTGESGSLPFPWRVRFIGSGKGEHPFERDFF